jgi:hypothetical protein
VIGLCVFGEKLLIDRNVLIAQEILIRLIRPYVKASAHTWGTGFYLMKNSGTTKERMQICVSLFDFHELK